MNRRLAARPVDPRRRLPIPHAQLLHPDGTANFAVINAEVAIADADARLCGLCGQPIGYWVAFIAGQSSAQQRAFLDPPMDVECARDALRLCPHLARQRVPRRPDSDNPGVIPPPGFVEGKPDRFALYITRSYKLVVTGPDTYFFEPAPAKTIRWFCYVDGVLTEEQP